MKLRRARALTRIKDTPRHRHRWQREELRMMSYEMYHWKSIRRRQRSGKPTHVHRTIIEAIFFHPFGPICIADHAPVAAAVPQHLRKRPLKMEVNPSTILVLPCPLHLTAQEQTLLSREPAPTSSERRFARRKARCNALVREPGPLMNTLWRSPCLHYPPRSLPQSTTPWYIPVSGRWP